MSDYDLVVKNGKVVVPGQGVIRADIGIKGERIACLSEDLSAEVALRVIDGKGKHVFPGVIDPHVHLGWYYPFCQDLQTESKAAAAGGVTTMLTTLATVAKLGCLDIVGDAPETTPAVRYSDILPRVQKEVEGCSSIDFALRAIIKTREHIGEMESLYRQFGIGSFKFYMTYKYHYIDDGLIYRGLRNIAKMEPPPMPQAHCENNDIVELATEEVKMSGMGGLRAWNAARPNVAEEVDIAKICLLARRAGSPIYIVHVSTAEGIEVVAEEQQKGTQVIGETLVHYLGLTEQLEGVIGKVAPPLRKQGDVEALWEGIRKGVITCVGTDHLVRPKELKQGDIWTACLGFPSMELLLPAMITLAMERNIPLTTVAEVCSLNCAKAFRLLPKKGTIAVGSDADLVVVDLEQRRTVDASQIYSVGKFTPFDGMSLLGWPELTILRGQVIFEKGIFSEPIGRNIRVTPEGIF